MPFKPLPEEFLVFLGKLGKDPQARVLDLGSGDGAFARLLSRHHVAVMELDRWPLDGSSGLFIRGDALHPPVSPGCLDCLLSGNLLRHLLVQDPRGLFLKSWLELLKPGGLLFIFEDEPEGDEPAARNFRDLQAFLAELMPSARGPLISRQYFLDWAEKRMPGQEWFGGVVPNQNYPDEGMVREMLTSGGTNLSPGGNAGKLLASIEQHGLKYGSYWWAAARIAS